MQIISAIFKSLVISLGCAKVLATSEVLRFFKRAVEKRDSCPILAGCGGEILPRYSTHSGSLRLGGGLRPGSWMCQLIVCSRLKFPCPGLAHDLTSQDEAAFPLI